MNYHRFFGREAEEVAKDLLGRLLVRTTDKGVTSTKIIETGAYTGGETESRDGMRYEPGRIFLMPYRGHYLLNITTGRRDYPSCVEIRAVASHDRIVRGSGSITKFLDIPSYFDGIELGLELKVIGDPVDSPEIKRIKGNSENCDCYFSIKK